jgi:anionic cell wall polymer biosynthesis LytR-Cps2A-Psr (LCP) family protein
VVECVDLLDGVVIPEVTDEEAVLMYGYMDEINKLTDHNSKYLTSGGTNVLMDGVQACAYARIRYTTGGDYKRTERQRTVIAAMVEKAKKSDLKTISSVIDAAFGDILTSYSNTDLIGIASQLFNYNLGETTGFPFEKNTIKLGSKGDVVAPCDLESNVIQLHEFLYQDENYVPSETVKNNSAKIINDTGYHKGEGY